MLINQEVKLNPRDKLIREPKQSRSINKKEKVLDAAMDLYCEKGYYKTTTNEIAQRAQVSIGTLYSYFKDKDTIFFEVLEKYHEKFIITKNEILNDTDFMKTDVKAWLRTLIENLIKVHEESKLFNREINVLSYYNTEVAEILEKNRKITMKETVGYFLELEVDLKIEDVEATATVIFDLISATVDRIVFGKNEIEQERLINSVLDLITKYLGK